MNEGANRILFDLTSRETYKGRPRRPDPVLSINVPDFISNTMALGPEHVGALLHMMLYYASKGELPAGEQPLRMISRVYDVRKWRRIWPLLQQFVAEAEGGKLKMPMVDEWAAQRAPRLDVGATEWGRLRLSVFERDRFTCRYCGEADLTEPHCDHVVPRSKGGPSTLENLVTSCGPCNVRKGAREPEGRLQ